jgi:hypothetical protein
MSGASADSWEPILAEFRPLRTDDLKPDATSMIGAIGAFEPLWRIADGDYRGQWALRIPGDWPIQSAVWVPECDLRPVP